MATRGRTGLGIIGVLGLAVAVGVVGWTSRPGRRAAVSPPTTTVEGAKSPRLALAERVRRGEARALLALHQEMTAKVDGPPKGLEEAEGAEWIEILAGLRAGFPKFGGRGRAASLVVVGQILRRFASEPAPAGWGRILPPSFELVAAGLADRELEVRIAAVAEVGRLWSWAPGRAMIPVEEQAVAQWKEGLYAPVVRLLTDPEPGARAAAVACLGALPIDAAAEPAVAGVHDPDAVVRQQTLVAFAGRRDLVTEEDILPLLYDPSPAVAPVAEQVLRGRGLSQEQVGLGKLISHPRAEMRVGAIPLLQGRSDINPSIWLLHLSHDPAELVRVRAVEALAGHDSPEVRKRLEEMARTDPSAPIREAAGKLVPAGSDATAALPPLPGSPRLNPKAN
jgi:HEAT repeats